MTCLISVAYFFLWAASVLQFSRSRSFDDNTQLKSALNQGDMELARDLIVNTAIQELSGPKEKNKVFDKLRVVQSLLSSRLVRVNNQEDDLEKDSCKECSFDIVFIPGSSLITHLVVNVTAVKNWRNNTIRREPIHTICSLPDVSPDMVQKFLEHSNVDVNSRTESGTTPLMLAAETGNLELVKFLIERGAKIDDIASITYNNDEALKGHFAFAKIFSKTKLKTGTFQKHTSPLVAAIRSNDVKVINYLISEGADVNINGHSTSAIFPAVDQGQTEIVKLLLQSGTNVNCKDMLGSTALHKAAATGNVDIAKILVENGASLNASDVLGWTPLHVAAFYSKSRGEEMIRFLVQSGSSIQSLTDGGYSPLNLLEAGYNPNFLSFLVQNLDCLNETKNYTDLPQEDMTKINAGIVDSVIQLGALLNHQDDILGWTTLHWASASGDLDVAKLLVKYGAAISVRSKTNRKPIETAIKFGRANVAEFLKTAKELVR